MKKKMKRFLPVFACFVLLSGLFVMPVSAASNGWTSTSVPFNQWYNDYSLTSNPNLYLRFYQNSDSSSRYLDYGPTSYLYGTGAGSERPITGFRWRISGIILENNAFASVGDNFFVHTPSAFIDGDFNAGDRLYLDFNSILIGMDPSLWVLNSGRFYCYFGDTDDIASFPISFSKSNSNGNYHFNDLSFEYDFGSSSSSILIWFEFNVTLKGTGDGSFSFTSPDGLTLNYGNPNSPEAPKYNKPDDGGAVGDLDDLEGEVGQQSQEGMNAANDTFQGFGSALSEFTLGLQFVSVLMRTFIFKMPWLNALFTISLGLGLFGFIVGLAGALVGASDRKAAREYMRNEKKKIWREEARNHYKNKG